jgi:hypothetical protein
MPLIQSPGPVTILTVEAKSSNASTASSTSVAGSWYEISPRLDRLGFHVVQIPSSAGGTLNSTIYIEVSNDGLYPIATKAATFALAGSTWQSDGATLNTSMQGAWRYIRANANSVSTSTAASTGVGAINVTVNASLKY